MKKKALIVFKYPHEWNVRVVNKFSNYYETESLYISDLKNKNFIEIIDEINNFIESKKIEVIVFDVDYFKFINFFFIENINCKKKILITGDDFELHEMNAITAGACDLVLSHCPLSVLKYKEKGFESYRIDFERGKLGVNDSSKKEIDVLFFGALTDDRVAILNFLQKEGIKLKNVGHVEGESGLSEKDLLSLISQ